MATAYPTALDTSTQQPSPSSSTEMDDSGYEHDIVHTNHSGALIALETKLGIGSTTAAGASTNHVLVKQGDGDTEWAAVPAGAVPTTITVADTTDTTCSVALFESATGDLAPKSDAGATYNAATGVLTATGFAGPITGNVTGNASTATNSTTVTVADTTDTTCSVALFESATGSLGAKSDAGLTYNAGTGALTATAFAGPLTGAVTGAASLNLLLAGGTLSGTVVAADQIVQRPVMKDYAETVNVIGGTGGGTQDIDLELGNVVTATVDTSTNTFTFSNPSPTGKACSFTLFLTNGGSQTVAWPGTVDWAGGTAPTLTASGVDILTFTTVDAGTIWYGFAAGLAMA